MPDISIQYYAILDENQAFIRSILDVQDVHALLITMRPFQETLVNTENIDDLIDRTGLDYRWSFNLTPFVLGARHELEFADKNPDHLRLDIGRMYDNMLEQSWLSCRTENKPVLRIWRVIARKLKAMTIGGVVAINRRTGQESMSRALRFTRGAKHLESCGGRMLAVVGPKGPLMRLGDVAIGASEVP